MTGEGGYWSYLRTTVRDECTTRARRRAVEDRIRNDYLAIVARNGAAYAADAVASYATESALARAFDRLPNRYRLVLILTVAERRSCAEVGAILNLGDNAVAALAYRARKRFGCSLKKNWAHLRQVLNG